MKILSRELKFLYGRKKSVNKQHLDYPEYIRKCSALRDRYWALIKAEEERLKVERPNWMNCKDGLESAQKRQLYQQMYAELRTLQEEYAYLFTEEIRDEDDQDDTWPDVVLLPSLW